jgi:hypothetical protein
MKEISDDFILLKKDRSIPNSNKLASNKNCNDCCFNNSIRAFYSQGVYDIPDEIENNLTHNLSRMSWSNLKENMTNSFEVKFESTAVNSKNKGYLDYDYSKKDVRYDFINNRCFSLTIQILKKMTHAL